jgi:hypothetical protein
VKLYTNIEWYQRIAAKYGAHSSSFALYGYGDKRPAWSGFQALGIVASDGSYAAHPTPLLMPADPRSWLVKPANEEVASDIANTLTAQPSSNRVPRTLELMMRAPRCLALQWQDWALPLLKYLHRPGSDTTQNGCANGLTLERVHVTCYALAIAHTKQAAARNSNFIEVAEGFIRLNATPSDVYSMALKFLDEVHHRGIPASVIGWSCNAGALPSKDSGWEATYYALRNHTHLDNAPVLKLSHAVKAATGFAPEREIK